MSIKFVLRGVGKLKICDCTELFCVKGSTVFCNTKHRNNKIKMFSRQGGLSNQGGSNNHLVEFRAGRMNLIGKMVHPDTRKGLVYMTQSDDGLMHFCWKNRTTGKVYI